MEKVFCVEVYPTNFPTKLANFLSRCRNLRTLAHVSRASVNVSQMSINTGEIASCANRCYARLRFS